MDVMTTREAAERCNVTARQFHGFAATLGLAPERKLPGIRGAMLWSAETVDEVRDHVRILTTRRATR